MLGHVTFAACTYEAAALASRGRLPTITRIAWRHRDTFQGLVAIIAALSYLGFHLLCEEDDAE